MESKIERGASCLLSDAGCERGCPQLEPDAQRLPTRLNTSAGLISTTIFGQAQVSRSDNCRGRCHSAEPLRV